ncbi:MAG: GlsB/YeaQ/YmgE family stress response membrane protein, partial [Planctomycetia bacterium]|nr:GlsB/YeaQ/YmgE family stress response membrane protein [Planctomycetia bacterium]
MLSLLSWILTGLIVGLIARALVPGKQHIGTLLTIALGIVGAIVGGLISSAIWPTWTNDPDVNRMWPGWLMSIAGGVIVLLLYLAIRRHSSGPNSEPTSTQSALGASSRRVFRSGMSGPR